METIPKYIKIIDNIATPPPNPPKLAKAHNTTKNEITDETVTLLYLNTSLIIEVIETTLLFISPLQLNIVPIQISITTGAINGINGTNNNPTQKSIEKTNTKKNPINKLPNDNEVSHFGLPVSLVFLFTEKNHDI